MGSIGRCSRTKLGMSGLRPHGGVADLLEELDGVVGGADVGVLVHLQGDLLPVALRVLGELADQRGRATASPGVVVVQPSASQNHSTFSCAGVKA